MCLTKLIFIETSILKFIDDYYRMFDTMTIQFSGKPGFNRDRSRSRSLSPTPPENPNEANARVNKRFGSAQPSIAAVSSSIRPHGESTQNNATTPNDTFVNRTPAEPKSPSQRQSSPIPFNIDTWRNEPIPPLPPAPRPGNRQLPLSVQRIEQQSPPLQETIPPSPLTTLPVTRTRKDLWRRQLNQWRRTLAKQILFRDQLHHWLEANGYPKIPKP